MKLNIIRQSFIFSNYLENILYLCKKIKNFDDYYIHSDKYIILYIIKNIL